jgi:two-component system, NtrC family, sensor kinase
MDYIEHAQDMMPLMDDHQAPRTPKRVVLFLAGGALSLLFLGALALLYLVSENALKNEYSESQRDLGRALASSLDSTLRQSGAVLLLIARTTPFEQLRDDLHFGRILLWLRKDHGQVFQDLGLVEESGRQVAYTGPFDLLGVDYGPSPWLPRALERELFLSDLLLGQRQRPHFVLTGRFTHAGQPWLLKTSLDQAEIQHILSTFPLPPESSVLIINRDGAVQALSDRNIPLNPQAIASLAGSLRGLGEEQQVLYADAGFSYLMTPMNNGAWGVVLQRDTTPVQPGQLTLLRWILIAAVAGMAMIFLILALLVRWFKAVHGVSDSVAMQAMSEQFIEAGKMASIGELAAGIAHEINNPIATMVEEAGWMEDLLQEDEELATTKNYQELRRALSQIKTQGARCKDITHKMLSFARKSDLRIQDIHINNLIREVAALSDKRARYANSQIIMNLDPDVPPIAASATEMQQVFLNLINNALDAMEKTGGSITITTRKLNEMVEIHFADTGEGIPKANLSRIFDPFYTTKPVGKGTGLGLSICYTIIKNMGGDISVVSQVGVGTTFTLRLPVDSASETGKHSSKPAISP